MVMPLASHIIAQMETKTKIETKPTQRSQITDQNLRKEANAKNVQFRFMPTAFRILKPIQKSSKRV